MHKGRITSALIGLFVTFTLVGCPKIEDPKSPKEIRSKVKKEVGHGKLNGKTYTNDYFNLKITISESWYIASKAAKKEVRNFNQKFV